MLVLRLTGYILRRAGKTTRAQFDLHKIGIAVFPALVKMGMVGVSTQGTRLPGSAPAFTVRDDWG
jgi:hypothetical protein